VELEQAPHEPPCRLADHHRARLRKRLQPGCEVRRFAHHRVPVTPAPEVADNNVAGRDADARLEHRTGGRPQGCYRLHQLEPGAHRPLGVVLMRLRPAEVNQGAVAHVSRHVPIPAPHDLGHTGLIGADHLPHLLGIKPGRELRRAHEIAEQYCELAPFGFTRCECSRRRSSDLIGFCGIRARGNAKSGDRL
jgi:hypothetical protein